MNRATQGLYPPGSTFKIVTAAAALESGKYTPDSTFYDPGYCTEYGKQVSNAGNADADGPEQFGNLNFTTAFEHSVNAVFCNIGKSLGAAKRARAGEEVRLLLQAAARDAVGHAPRLRAARPEDAQALRPEGPERRRSTRAASRSARSGCGVSPLQMAMVAAGIANHGKVMTPQLVKKVVAPDGDTVSQACARACTRRRVSPKNADAIRDMMVAVVQGGTGTQAQIPGVTVAGKTGTAETGTPRRLRRLVRLLRAGREPACSRARSSSSGRRTASAAASRPRSRSSSCRRSFPHVERHVIDDRDDHHRPPPQPALRPPVPDPAQARRRAGWPTSTSPRTRSSGAASR